MHAAVGGGREYLVKWVGHPEGSWEPAGNCEGCPVLVAAFDKLRREEEEEEEEEEEDEDIKLEASSSSDEESDTQSEAVAMHTGQRLEYLFNDSTGQSGFCCGTIARAAKWPGWWKIDFDDGKQECVLIDREGKGANHLSRFFHDC